MRKDQCKKHHTFGFLPGDYGLCSKHLTDIYHYADAEL